MTPSSSRRPLPASAARRGWCPGLSRPMPTGDGLLARIHPPLGILTLPQARAVAEGARRFGNGHLDVTARGNLQVRGVSEATRAPLAHLLEAAGLGDGRADGGPQRLTLASPLAGRDPAEVIDVPTLARTIEAAGLAIPGLPAKTLVAIEGRPGVAMPDADVFVRALARGRVGIAVASEHGPADLIACDALDAPAAVSTLLGAFARSGRRRVRDLSVADRAAVFRAIAEWGVGRVPATLRSGGSDDRPAPEGQNAIVPAPNSRPHPEVRSRSARLEGALQGSQVQLEDSCEAAARHLRMGSRVGVPPLGMESPERGDVTPMSRPAAGLTGLSAGLQILAVDAPFGRCTADALDRLSEAAAGLGAVEIRLSPARGFVLMVENGARAGATLAALARDFIVARDDPRRSIAACTGAPACASGSTPTLTDAARLAEVLGPLAAGGFSAHVSGCAKGCARPGPADLTLVGRDGLYGAVIGGGPGDVPTMRLPIEAALERLGRAGTIGLAAAFAPDHAVTGCGRDGRPA